MNHQIPHARTSRGHTAERAHTASALHPVLRRLFAEWQRQGLRWALLRAPSDPIAPTGDVDILVAPDDADKLRLIAVGAGFVPMPGRDRPPTLLLASYDRGSDRWLVLDVATDVCFRTPRGWGLAGAADTVLDRCRFADGMAVPSDGDAFWLLLLHCLLDKRCVPEHYRGRLNQLASASLRSTLGEAVQDAAGSEFNPLVFVDAVRASDWLGVTDLGSLLALELARRRSVRERLRVAAGAARESLRKPLLLPRRKGMSIALLGPNGVGKSTAAAGLQRSFPFESRAMYMGMWKGIDTSRAAGRVVGEIGARPLRIWRRYLVAQYHQLRGRLVVFDRYVYDAFLPPSPPLVAAKRAYFWLLVRSIPRPTSVVVLDAPSDVAYRRKQENLPHELEHERRAYGTLGSRIGNLELIDARADAEVVRANITAIVWRELAERWCRGSVRS